jgi:hypothetical protein
MPTSKLILSGRRLPVEHAELGAPTITSIGAHHDFAVEAARFLVVLGLLAEVGVGPLRIELDRRERKTRHVNVHDRLARPRDTVRSPPPAAEINRRVAEDRWGKRHLKRQRFGEALREVKWI